MQIEEYRPQRVAHILRYWIPKHPLTTLWKELNNDTGCVNCFGLVTRATVCLCIQGKVNSVRCLHAHMELSVLSGRVHSAESTSSFSLSALLIVGPEWEEYFVVSISLLYQNQYIIHSVHVIRGSTVTVGVSQYSGIPFVYILHTWIIDGVAYSCLCKSCVSPVFITFMHHWTWHKPCSSLIFFRFICISRSTVAI